MKLILVRHGETEENRVGIIQGHLPGRLSKEGKQQVRELALRLKEENLDYIYSSDLARCIKTAKEILKFHPSTELRLSPELREQGKGKLEGKLEIDLKKLQEKSKEEWGQFRPKNGESGQDVWNRVVKFYQKVKREHQKQSVLIVSHGGPIRCLLTYLHKEPIQDSIKYKPQNTAISVIKIDKDGKCNFQGLNYIKHFTVKKTSS